ncbi:hypothetical protein BGX30_007497, partial [Mortierella sp. GBA39]
LWNSVKQLRVLDIHRGTRQILQNQDACVVLLKSLSPRTVALSRQRRQCFLLSV